MDGQSSSVVQWLVGIAITICTGIGAVALHLYSLVNGARREAKEGDNALWSAVNAAEKKNGDFREDIIEKVALLPTKEDNQRMEDRIMAAIVRERS